MGLSQALTLFGGLSLFLYSMNMMSAGLEAAAGNKMKSVLEKLTSSTFMGVIVGTVITAITALIISPARRLTYRNAQALFPTDRLW